MGNPGKQSTEKKYIFFWDIVKYGFRLGLEDKRQQEKFIPLAEKVQGESVPQAPKPWSGDIVRCADGTRYTGICTDVDQRGAEHNGNVQRTAKKCNKDLIIIIKRAVL